MENETLHTSASRAGMQRDTEALILVRRSSSSQNVVGNDNVSYDVYL